MSRRVSLLALTVVLALLIAGCGGGSSSGTGDSTRASGGVGAAGAPSSANGGKNASTTGSPTPQEPLVPPAGAPPRSVRVPVLTYHRVAPLSAVGITDLKVEPANFVAELTALQQAGYHTIHQSQLFDALWKGAALPPKPVIISVDDGYTDDITRVLPALQRMHMVATFFVITGRTQEPGFLNEDQIRQLDRTGMDVGDHTAHHVDLRLLTAAELQTETAGSRRTLERILGHPVYYFAYPFGAYNDRVLGAVRDAGFTMAFSTVGGSTESTRAPLTMPRIHVGRALTPSELLSQLGG